MFWKFNLLHTSHIDALLDKEDVTLHELMDEDDILQECKAQNRKLINFLVLPENMEELVKLITEEPTEDMDEKVRYKYPNTACELLTSDVSQVNDSLAGSDDLIHKLYAFLESDSTLNPLLASFFSKVMGLLITRKSEMILEYLKAKEDFVGTLLRHIGTSAIMDLLLRLLTCIESPEVRRAMVEWLNDQRIVKKLVNSITPAYDEDIHCNAAQSLCDIIRLGREQLVQLNSPDRTESDPLLASVEMEETVAELLDNMLSAEKNESVIVNGLSVIQTLLEFKKQGPEDSVEQVTAVDAESIFHGVNNVLTAICPRLKDFHSILIDPPKQRYSCMPSTVGSLDPPLGNTRLQTARLISTLILANRHSINVELAQLGTIHVLLELYFKYIWNNFLHSHVTQCIYTILSNAPVDLDGKKEHPLLTQLFTEVQIVQKILDQWNANDQEQSQDGGKRRGFMGHLTRMANDIVHTQEKGENADLVKSHITELSEEAKEKWEAFLNGTLLEANKRNTVELVRGHPLASSSEDDDADFRDIPFPQDTAMQQAFSDYQLQQMTSNFIDQFGFNEEEFGEQEEKTDSPFTDRVSSIDFGVGVNEDTRANASMFEQTCNERLQQFDNDSDEDIWEEKEITFSQNTQTKRSERLPVATNSQDSDDSTDSEEELDSPKRIVQQPSGEKMDIDTTEGWTANFEEAAADGGPVAMDTSPWDSSAKEQPEKWADFTNKVPQHDREEDENWADFSSFSDLDSKQNAPRSSSPVAMDTTEPAARNTAYITDKESDLAIQSIDSSEDVSQTSTSQEPDSTTETSAITTSTESSTDSSHVQLDSTTPATEKTGQNVAQSSTTAGREVEEIKVVPETETPDSSTGGQKTPPPEPSASPPDKPPTPPSQPPPSDDDDEGAIPQSPRTPSSTSAPSVSSVESAPSKATDSSPDTKAKGDGSNIVIPSLERPASDTDVKHDNNDDDDDDDLNSNFNFLTKVGLMKPVLTNCNQATDSAPDDLIQGNGPTNENAEAGTDPDNCKLAQMEDLRAQAKDALDSYDNAISTGASVQNGPV